MARKNHKVAYFVWFIMFIGVAGILFTGANADKYFTFAIKPNAVTSTGVTFGGNVELPDVNCLTKVTTNGYDKNNKIILTDDSPFFEKHPKTTYSLVGGADNSEVVKFEITPKIRCEFINNAKYVPMTLQTANIKAFVMAKDSKNVEKEVWNGVMVGKDIPIVNNHEEEITKFTVNTSDLFKYMEKGEYKTLLTFQITGTMDFIYTGYNTVHYAITVPRDSVQTYIETTVTKDTPAQTQSSNDSTSSDPKVKDAGTEQITDDLTKLSLCATTVDIACLSQSDFIPYYIGGLGFVFLIGAMTTKNHPVFDQYGNRLR